MKVNNLRSFRDSLRLRLITADEAGKEPDGANAESGPTEETSSGFGGLGFEGIVGMVEDPGEGKRGAISGDNSVYGDNGGFAVCNVVGAAEILGILGDKDSEGETCAKVGHSLIIAESITNSWRV
ncbi:hypothetical protein ACH5RR_031176 [Cinchona calisaya]|uniref:Uncharacterized protein n=1 Tax=Cinchona calisaya TaxID=153742 RepID=A0ABD2YIG1_9GENT